jgi:hypothetical protein
LYKSGHVEVGNVTNLTIGGSLVAGIDATIGGYALNGSIRSRYAIGALNIRGNIVGNASNAALISAGGQLRPRGTSDMAIGSITVNGNVSHAKIRAGDSGFLDFGIRNADAQIGNVVIGGNWTASEMGAGTYTRSGSTYSKIFADDIKDSPRVNSRIASITIGGTVRGTSTVGDQFGFIAENIGSLRIGTTSHALNTGKSNDNLLLDSVFGDTRLVEY